MNDSLPQCDATRMSEEFAPVLFQCTREPDHEGEHAFITDTDFAVLSMVADKPEVTP